MTRSKPSGTSPELTGALARLDDYVRGHQSDSEAAAFEEDLFERALQARAPELTWQSSVGHTLAVMHRRGTLDMWLTASGFERLRSGGLRVLYHELDPSHPKPPELTADFDILVTRVPLDLSGIRQLDAEILTPDGKQLKVMRDIEFDPADGAVFACCEAELARIAASARTVARVWATDESGRHLVATLESAP